MNFLEELAAEWYEYQGFFVRTNIKFGKRPRGGWKGEMDVVAYHPKTKAFIHIETSSDAQTWEKKRANFARKFRDAADHYGELFPFPRRSTEQIAVAGFSRPRRPERMDFGGSIRMILVPDFVRGITQKLRNINPVQQGVPEAYPLLRAIQYSAFYARKDGSSSRH